MTFTAVIHMGGIMTKNGRSSWTNSGAKLSYMCEIAAMPVPFHDAMLTLRRAYLTRQLEALIARVDIVKGKKMKFDEESKAIYDSVAPHHDEAYFENLTRELDRELPGKGAIADRLDAYKKDFIIPKDKLDAVFKAAVDGCRSRTLQHKIGRAHV